MRIGLMGGTFDPIHIGHLVTAEAARHRFELDRVFFVPAGQPPHKRDRRVTMSEHRYLMSLLATAANPSFYVSRVEIDRSGLSFTNETISYFRRAYDLSEDELYFITGADAMRDIHKWHNYEEILENCHVVAASRPGFTLDNVIDKAHFSEAQLRHIHILTVPSLAISSTDIRLRVQEDRPIRYLVLESVENYIYKHGLYVR